jgi:hypothetical protein
MRASVKPGAHDHPHAPPVYCAEGLDPSLAVLRKGNVRVAFESYVHKIGKKWSLEERQIAPDK